MPSWVCLYNPIESSMFIIAAILITIADTKLVPSKTPFKSSLHSPCDSCWFLGHTCKITTKLASVFWAMYVSGGDIRLFDNFVVHTGNLVVKKRLKSA